MINGVGVKTHFINIGDIMANRNVVGKVMIVLEIPNEGLFHPDPNRAKGNFDIINEIILQGVSVTDWSSNGTKLPGGHNIPVVTLTYEGGA